MVIMGRSGFTDKGVNHSLGVSHFNRVVKDQKALKSKAKACKVKRAIISIKGHKNGMLGDSKSFYTIGLGYTVVTLILSSSSSSSSPPPPPPFPLLLLLLLLLLLPLFLLLLLLRTLNLIRHLESFQCQGQPLSPNILKTCRFIIIFYPDHKDFFFTDVYLLQTPVKCHVYFYLLAQITAF